MIASLLLSALLISSYPNEEINMMQVKNIIFESYYKELPDSLKKLPWKELKTHLDPYTRLLDKRQSDEFKKDMSMIASGVVGIMVDTSDLGFYIEETYMDGSAYEKGLMRGDIIKKIDNKVPRNKEELSKLIRGKVGTTVQFEIKRNGKTLTFNLERDIIHYPNVYSVKLNKTAIIRIESFHELSALDFLMHSVSLNPKEVDTLIIDLRNNGGGLLHDCLIICDEFFDKNHLILSTINRNDTLNYYTKTDDGVWIGDKTIFILQNEFTASASELLSGVIKYGKGGKIVGTKSFGKGLVQTQFDIENATLFVTSSEYFPMGKVKVNNTGIFPDYALGLYLLEETPFELDLEAFRKEYPHPSIQALQDNRIKDKGDICHLIWEVEGELFEILMQKPYISK